jgi:hypothetical protein
MLAAGFERQRSTWLQHRTCGSIEMAHAWERQPAANIDFKLPYLT